MKKREIRSLINGRISRGWRKVVALTLCGALAAGGAGGVVRVMAEETEKAGESGNQAAQSEKSRDETPKEAGTEAPGEVFKEETVYVLADAEGAVQKIIVSDWLKNASGAEEIKDATGLRNVENVKGEESYTAGEGDSLLWNARGADIYYQGNTDRELPVSLSVTYLLEGKEISPEELAGKSGKVTIRYTYTNNEYEYAEINGVRTKIYVPFAAATGMVLEDTVFSNVEIVNGRLINDGDRTIVIGIALPGLQENLGIHREKLEIPDYMEITADVKNFRLGMTVTAITSEVFGGISLDDRDLTGELDEMLEELTDAMKQLMDGFGKLYEGLDTLLEKSGELTEGIHKLSDGASRLQTGIGTLNDGTARLQEGASNLQDGLNTLSSKNGELNGGARQVFETLLSAAQAQLNSGGLSVPAMTVENYGEVLDGVIASLDQDEVYKQALNQVTAAVEAQRGYIESQVTAAAETEVRQKVTAAVKEQVAEKVRPEVEARIAPMVEAAAAEEVRNQVMAAAREKVTKAAAEQMEAAVRADVTPQVIRQITGMEEEDYRKAVEAGEVEEEVRKAVESRIDSTVKEQMASEEAGAALDSLVNEQMDSDAVKASVESQVAEQMNSDAVREMITAKTAEQMESAETAAVIETEIGKQMETDSVKAIIENNVKQQMASEEVKAVISAKTQEQVQTAITENMANDEVKAQMAAASEGLKSVVSLKASLDSYQTFYQGLQAYTAGVSEAASGAGQLTSGIGELQRGTGELSAGAGELKNGIQTMENSVPALTDGITQLRDGAKELSDGLAQLNEEGIQKLVDAAEGDLEGLTQRLRALQEAADRYKSFGGIREDMEGKVKFVYRTEGIESGE